ncbi:methionine-R-sulfoxide reductase B1 isoform X3 [Polyergus mexicanus]|uniref:methionine-R-sulfoxide reductase B1 isoform X3 n=1 Tax=Polyergus mexicanus TaxID=615972 RepID=UPI0038B4D997
MTTVIDKEEARKRLTPLQWHVTQEKGTERPFSGCYNKFYEKGTYTCIVCDQELFSSDTKYDSGCGWPAFNEVLDQGRIKLTKDISHASAKVYRVSYLHTEIKRFRSTFHTRREANSMLSVLESLYCAYSLDITNILCTYPY